MSYHDKENSEKFRTKLRSILNSIPHVFFRDRILLNKILSRSFERFSFLNQWNLFNDVQKRKLLNSTLKCVSILWRACDQQQEKEKSKLSKTTSASTSYLKDFNKCFLLTEK